MNRIVLSFVVIAALASGCSAKRQAQWDSVPANPSTAGTGTDQQSLEQQAQAAWEKRDDEQSLRAAISAWEQLAQTSTEPKLHAQLSRAYYFLADAHVRKQGTKSDAYLETFEKGTAAGERGLAAANPEFKQRVTSGEPVEKAITSIGPESAEAAYWYAANLGKWARAKGFATTLGNKDKIKATMDKVLQLDPNFFHAAPHRYFGAFYAVAPGFAGGDMNKSKDHFDKSIELSPNYAGTKVLMAEVYAAKLKDRELFNKLLDEVLAMPDDALPELVPETKAEKEKAQELKAKIEELM